MIAYPDTSFLFALYIPHSHSEAAIAHYEGMEEPLHVTTLVLYELRQSLRFQAYRNTLDKTQGYPAKTAETALGQLQANLDAGALALAAPDWAQVHQTAEQLSRLHTRQHGYRALDILHVATAQVLRAAQFLTFDAAQRKLARSAGLVCPALRE